MKSQTFPPRVNKPRFAVDINISFVTLQKSYSQFATFKSTASLTKKQDAGDDEIVKICDAQNYHIITHNTKHFEGAPKKFLNLKVGIICVNLKESNYIGNFGKLLRERKKHDNYKRKLIVIGNETRVKSYSEIRKHER